MSRPRILCGAVCVLLSLVTLLVYLPVRHYAFVHYDDPHYVTENPVVQAGLTWTGVKWAFTTLHASNWHPLTWLSHMLDCQLFCLNAGGHHLVNVFFHAANAVLLFLLLLRMTGARWQCAFIAALFAWHPLHVESVAWVAERKDVLSAFFGLLTLMAYVRYAQGRGQGTGKGESAKAVVISYGLALLLFALGLMAKPMLVTLPFVFLLLDYWPLQRVPGFELRIAQWSRLVLEKWPFFALAAASCVVTFIAQKNGEAVVSLVGYPLPSRIENAAVAYVKYLFESVYPVNLAVIYPLSKEIPLVQVVGAMLVLAVMTWLIWRARQRCPYLLTGWFWYLGMLVPVIGLVQVGSQAMADRYTYLPLIGVFIGVVFGLVELAKKLRFAPVLMIVVAGIILAGCLFATARQLQYWRDSETLFEHAVAATTNNPIAQDNLGVALGEAGQLQEAMEHFREALRLNPDFMEQPGKVHNNLGHALLQTGQPQEAIEHFREALRLEPDDATVRNNLGVALFQTGHLQEAIQHYQEALRLNSDYDAAHNNLGVALFQTGHLQEAIQHDQEALRLQPNFPEAHRDLGLALLRNGQMEEAIAQFRTALQLQPDFTAARDNLGNALIQYGQVLFQKGQLNQAIAPLQEGLQIRPDNVGAYNCLGYIFVGQGQAGEAVAQFQKALELQPDNLGAQNNLAWILATAPNAALRNGVKAVELAQQANQFSGGQNPTILDTLAAAYAEAGRFPEAVATAQKALKLVASQTNAAPEVNDLQTQIKFYQAGSPFRDRILTNSQLQLNK